MTDTYFDDALDYDWVPEGMPDKVSDYVADYKITCTVTKGDTVYDLTATGTYSLGTLVDVTDIETLNAEPVCREPEDA